MTKLVNRVVFWIIVGLIMLYLLFPFYWAVNSSLKNENQLMMTPTTFIPRDPVTKEFSPTLDNYRAVFQSDQFIRGLRNSAM